ncbi:hypothetical protein F0562_003881 [Nyssa sinensis]|uniref:Uncharacterized protein n=1 Tax=Nyssa sinensis TaxID=561372 RepID=A0A5J5BXC1_9ASTE|nr:hypothetical protein F0562_003881 [Nyssa sinensis]
MPIDPLEEQLETQESHKGAAMFKNKSLPHFEKLLIIFERDRATRRNAQTATDVVEELNKEVKECSSQRRRRRRSHSNDNLLEAIKEVGLALGREIKESTIKLTKAMGYDVAVAENRVRINEESLKLPTISMFERHKATLQIARDQETTVFFFTIADDEKAKWVKALLRGDI